MPIIKLINQKGEVQGDFELQDAIFGIEPNEHVMHEAVVNYLANQRQGTHAVKTRAEVRGGGRKPFAQKGTGRARQGSIRAPHYVGGGVVFAKKPRDFSYRLPKKIKRLALFSALSTRVNDEMLKVVDGFTLENAKTKEMVEILKNVEAGKKVLIVLPEHDQTIERAARNIPGVKVLCHNNLNTYMILTHPTVIFTKDAVEKLQEVYQ